MYPLLTVTSVFAQEEYVAPAYIEENKECLKCHGRSYFSYFNETIGREIKERMSPYYLVDSAEYLSVKSPQFSMYRLPFFFIF